ncbi:MAG: IPTL-CTERM sorting domain-containing protein [Proteobacteria bacterium]|nr:IPTL-CTERM sorting domain-containing protein [Pseudomonadota bacterium]
MRSINKFLVLVALLFISSGSFAQATSCDNAYNPLANCSFESGDFTGWTVKDIAAPFSPAQVITAGNSLGFGFFDTAPTDGTFVSLNGFDGGGPDTIEYSQDITLPIDAGELTFDYRAGWDMDGFCGGCTGSRIFTVEIQPSGGGAALASQDFLMANPGEVNLDTGDLSGSFSLNAYKGQSVRIMFLWTIPEAFTGPAQFQLDNVNIITGAPVLPAVAIPTLSATGLTSLALLMLLFAYLGINRRTA